LANTGIVARLLAPLLFCTTAYAQIIPSDRVTTWVPGVTYNGGIPNRTVIYRTLSPSGGDDTAAIQAALDGCPANQVVQLTAGTFQINSGALMFRSDNCTLRGAGPGTGFGGGTGTRLVRPTAANDTNMYVGHNQHDWATSFNLASDAVKGTN